MEYRNSIYNDLKMCSFGRSEVFVINRGAWRRRIDAGTCGQWSCSSDDLMQENHASIDGRIDFLELPGMLGNCWLTLWWAYGLFGRVMQCECFFFFVDGKSSHDFSCSGWSGSVFLQMTRCNSFEQFHNTRMDRMESVFVRARLKEYYIF